MTTGIFRGIEAMVSAERRLEMVAQNIANASSGGYKRRTSFTEVIQGEGDRSPDLVIRTGVDFSQGNLKATQNATDLAIHGDGFFAVEGDNGEVYTRDGRFHVDSQGNLLTTDGYPMAWERFSSRIDPFGQRVYVNSEGNIRQGTLEIGKLRIANFADRQQLVLDSKGYWNAPPGTRETAHTSIVRQGYLELSNAEPMVELIELIELQRAYESATNAVRSIDQGYRRLHQRR